MLSIRRRSRNAAIDGIEANANLATANMPGHVTREVQRAGAKSLGTIAKRAGMTYGP